MKKAAWAVGILLWIAATAAVTVWVEHSKTPPPAPGPRSAVRVPAPSNSAAPPFVLHIRAMIDGVDDLHVTEAGVNWTHVMGAWPSAVTINGVAMNPQTTPILSNQDGTPFLVPNLNFRSAYIVSKKARGGVRVVGDDKGINIRLSNRPHPAAGLFEVDIGLTAMAPGSATRAAAALPPGAYTGKAHIYASVDDHFRMALNGEEILAGDINKLAQAQCELKPGDVMVVWLKNDMGGKGFSCAIVFDDSHASILTSEHGLWQRCTPENIRQWYDPDGATVTGPPLVAGSGDRKIVRDATMLPVDSIWGDGNISYLTLEIPEDGAEQK